MKSKIKTILERTARIAVTLIFLLVCTTMAWAGDRKSEAPIGCMDDAEGASLYVHVWGWACDPYKETNSIYDSDSKFWYWFHRLTGSRTYSKAYDN